MDSERLQQYIQLPLMSFWEAEATARLKDVIGQTSTCKAHDTCPTAKASSQV